MKQKKLYTIAELLKFQISYFYFVVTYCFLDSGKKELSNIFRLLCSMSCCQKLRYRCCTIN